jgi:hypothetical protein
VYLIENLFGNYQHIVTSVKMKLAVRNGQKSRGSILLRRFEFPLEKVELIRQINVTFLSFSFAVRVADMLICYQVNSIMLHSFEFWDNSDIQYSAQILDLDVSKMCKAGHTNFNRDGFLPIY